MKLFTQLIVEWWQYQPVWARLPVLPLTVFVALLAAADETLTQNQTKKGN